MWSKDKIKERIFALLKKYKKIKIDRQLVIFIMVALVLILPLVILAWPLTKKNQNNKKVSLPALTNSVGNLEQPSAYESPLVAPRRLDGMVVAASDANQLPICVMIDNASFGGVRPQSGLSRALVVYEVIVEGGITRLMAIYGGESADKIGPIRSARDTFLEFASEYNCVYTHAGGSYTALKALTNFKMRDLDALREYRHFWRDTTKYAPHNLFSSTTKLDEGVHNHNWPNEPAPNFTSWKFVDVTSDISTSTDWGAQNINIAFGGSANVEYKYNSVENYYERWQNSQQQKDEVTGETITAKNIIVQMVGVGVSLTAYGRINWPVTGLGEVLIFRGGRVYRGEWKKENRLMRTLFFNANGQEMELVRGNIWVEIVPPHVKISYE